MIALVLAGYAALIFYEFVPLFKQRLWKDLWVNAVLCAASLLTAALLSFGVRPPSPAGPIREAVTSLFGK